MKRIYTGLAAAAAAVACVSAGAQEWPARPVRMIVGHPAGGPADLGGRLVAQKLAERLKQNVIVENRAGAAGNIGMEAGARAAPDGYTLLYAITALVINPATYKLSWDPVRDLIPISKVSSATFVLVATPSFGPKSVPEIIAYAKAKPKELTCGHSGSLPQVACELLRSLAGVDVTTVPYKGMVFALTDVSTGQINIAFDVQISATPAVRSGRVRAMATTNARRGIGPFGDLPTMAEHLPGFEMDGWHGVFVPAKTPREIVVRLNQEVRGLLSEPETRKRLNDVGMEPAGTTSEEFAEIVRKDVAKYEKIIREAGIKAD